MRVLSIVLIVLGALFLLTTLAGLLYFGVTGNQLVAEPEAFYTVSIFAGMVFLGAGGAMSVGLWEN